MLSFCVGYLRWEKADRGWVFIRGRVVSWCCGPEVRAGQGFPQRSFCVRRARGCRLRWWCVLRRWSDFELTAFRLPLLRRFCEVVLPRFDGLGSLKVNSRVTPPYVGGGVRVDGRRERVRVLNGSSGFLVCLVSGVAPWGFMLCGT